MAKCHPSLPLREFSALVDVGMTPQQQTLRPLAAVYFSARGELTQLL